MRVVAEKNYFLTEFSVGEMLQHLKTDIGAKPQKRVLFILLSIVYIVDCYNCLFFQTIGV